MNDALKHGDTAWMLVSSALVMMMVPGLALFYGGMVRRKNVLATMMQSMAALAVVGLYWLVIGYALAFGPSQVSLLGGGVIGWHSDLFCLNGIDATAYLPGTNIPVYAHVMFQGMFAVVTPALISGAVAERARFWPFCAFMILWVTVVYCPLAHMVWAHDWYYADPLDPRKGLGGTAIGLLARLGAIDFAGGTVVHIAAGAAGLAAALVLRRRAGYPGHIVRPNSIAFTLVGAGLLWVGWFGFNGGSAGSAGYIASSAIAATQVSAAAAGLSWILVERLVRGKPTALGLATGIVAGLVAVTPASGFVYPWGGMIIGAIAGAVCYFAVSLKTRLGYDDALDVFGVHAVGGFLGAVLTGIFCYTAVDPAGADGLFAVRGQEARPQAIQAQLETLQTQIADLTAAADKTKVPEQLADISGKLSRRRAEQTRLRDELAGLAGPDGTLARYQREGRGPWTQFAIQLKAAILALLFSFVVSLGLTVAVQRLTGGRFTTDVRSETEGLDQTEHGETGFDLGHFDAVPMRTGAEPRVAAVPPGHPRYDLIIRGVEDSELLTAWSDLCMPGQSASPEFKELYRYVTTVQGNRFQLRGGDPHQLGRHLQSLLGKKLGRPVKVDVEEWGRVSY